MPPIQKFVSVVRRHVLRVDDERPYLLPLLEPLFTIATHMRFEERCRLFDVACSLRQGFVACEVGSYLGSSTCFLAAAASLGQGHVHAVDTWKNDAMPNEPVEDTWTRWLENTERFRPFITPHRGEARQLKDEVPAIDLLFLDGDHSYEATLANLVDYAPKLLPEGIVAMHDFDLESVRAACRDYFQERPIADLGLTGSLQIARLL